MSGIRPEAVRLLESRFPGARIERLAGDGSTRSFLRITTTSDATVVAMDYARPVDGPTDDERMAAIFRAAGLPVAAILDSIPALGLLLLEDLGDTNLESALLSNPDTFRHDREPPELLLRAIDLAADVAERGTAALAASDRAGGPALDAERFRFEMEFFLEHFVAGHLGRADRDPDLTRGLMELASVAAESGPKVLCHRDFHSRNLMLRPSGDLVMVDIQDARWGPDTYDLASIVRDAYLPIPDAWVDPLAERYRSRRDPAQDRAALGERLHVVATQRMLKALGSFGYLSRVRDPRYLVSIGPTVARLRRSMPGHPLTSGLLTSLERAGALPAPS